MHRIEEDDEMLEVEDPQMFFNRHLQDSLQMNDKKGGEGGGQWNK
jgi:hypothetical protein